jgi:hypothetical protein
MGMPAEPWWVSCPAEHGLSTLGLPARLVLTTGHGSERGSEHGSVTLVRPLVSLS